MAINNFRTNNLIFVGSIITVSLGSLCLSLLIVYISNEMSMDRFHERADDIHLILQQSSPETPAELFEISHLIDLSNYPEIETWVKIIPLGDGIIRFTYAGTTYHPEAIVVDSTFFQVMNFKLMVGDKKTILSDPGSVILTYSMAKKIFGEQDPIGQIVEIDTSEKQIMTVGGIINDPPASSSLLFDLIIPLHSGYFPYTGIDFLLTTPGLNPEEFREKIMAENKNFEEWYQALYSTIAFRDLYFETGIVKRNFKSGDRRSIMILLSITLIITLIILLNLSNLQMVNISSRLKNIGIHRINGAGKTQIITRLGIEMILFILLTAFFVTLLSSILMPHFNNLVNARLAPASVNIYLLNCLIIAAFTLIALIYPISRASKINSITGIKGSILSRRYIYGQKMIITMQFTLMIILVCSTVLVGKQLKMMLNKKPGFNTDNIVSVRFFRNRSYRNFSWEMIAKDRDVRNNTFRFIADELNNNPLIENFSQGFSPLNTGKWPWKLHNSDQDYHSINMLTVTPAYAELLGLEIVEGRFFDQNRDQSRGHRIVINEAARKYFKMDNPLGKFLVNRYWTFDVVDGFEVIGVIKDFHNEHLTLNPQPLVMVYMDDIEINFLIKLQEKSVADGLRLVSDLYEIANPGEPFLYSFLDDEMAALYQKEKRLALIYSILSGIAILITIIGLFTITLYEMHRRTKEIGIRKANGAKTGEVIVMLNKEIIVLVAAAFIIALPVSWIMMNRWLQNFAYRTELSWWIFAFAGTLALLIALATVSWQSWQTARRNPVEALKYE